MRRLISLFAALSLLLCLAIGVSAEDSNVIYSGNAGKFVFSPGSNHSLTDLFLNFKGVMPGDSLRQRITVKNNASNNVKVKIYIRSLGADEFSEEFLSQLHLRVAKSEENDMAYMFDAAASETAQLTDWVCLGMLYSGGIVNLDVTLDVPVTLDNEFQNQSGTIDWMFKIEEFPIEDTDPKPAPTGDDTALLPAMIVMTVSAAALILLIFFYKRKQRSNCN